MKTSPQLYVFFRPWPSPWLGISTRLAAFSSIEELREKMRRDAAESQPEEHQHRHAEQKKQQVSRQACRVQPNQYADHERREQQRPK